MEYRWSGKKLCLEGGCVQLTKVLSRRLVWNLGECVIVAEGVIDGTDGPVVAKLRVELDPDDELEGSHYEEMAKLGCAEEIIALETLQDSGRTPRLLMYGATRQDESMPRPGGYIRAIVMSKLPGQNVADILLTLKEDEEESIEAQLAEVLEYMRQKGYCYVDSRHSNLIWNRETRKLYLVDLEAAILFSGEKEKIGPKSSAVKVFMITKRSRK